MIISYLLAGYILVLGNNSNIATVIPYEYQDKEECEKAANVVLDTFQTYCIPTDTHVMNKEFD